jgi:hypothetical protein
MKNWLVVAGATVLISPAAFGGPLVEANFPITPFSVSPAAGYTGLGLVGVNNFGSITGYEYNPTTLEYQGFMRSPSGKVQTLMDPYDTSNATVAFFTEAGGINDWGTVVGFYFNSAHNQYSGFLHTGSAWLTYNVPNLPSGSETDLYGINDLGDFCGDWRPSTNFNNFVPFLNIGGKAISFPIKGSTYDEAGDMYGACLGVNNLGWAAGTYQDTNRYHGFIRSPAGVIITIDVPGAVPNTLGANVSGTVLEGINDLGWTSGHFWDANGFEHGFLRSPSGTYYQIDVSGAETNVPGGGTSGGGLNNACVVVGHYDPVGSVEQGYFATPPNGCPGIR